MSTGQEIKVEFHGMVAEFADDRDLLMAAREARRFGYTKMEAYSPFPVHGIDDALGVPRSRLGWIVLGVGLTGTLSAILLQWWTGAVSYPLVIGGKPYFSMEFATPVTFELTILFAAFAAVVGMFALNGLPRFYHPVFNYSSYAGATDDRFLLVIEASDPVFDPDEGEDLMKTLGALKTELVEA
jgi:hypothetical protein